MKKLVYSIVLAAILITLIANVVLAAGGPSKYKCTKALTCKTVMLNGRVRKVWFGSTVFGPDGGGLATQPFGRGWVKVR